MAPSRTVAQDGDSSSHINSTAVAIDKGKNSQYAVRWAIDNLLKTNRTINLVHVRHKSIQVQHLSSSANGEVSSDGCHETTESDVQHLFAPYRGYCARKGVTYNEVVLDENDVGKGLLEHINTSLLNSIVVGASTRSTIARKFKTPDVPTALLKSAPEFCSVYVISKGKPVSVRVAARPLVNTAAPPRSPAPRGNSPHLSLDHHQSEPDNAARGQSSQKSPPYRSMGQERRLMDGHNYSKGQQVRDSSRNSAANTSMESIDISFCGPRTSSSSHHSFSEDVSFPGSLHFGSIDTTIRSLDFSNVSADASRDEASRSARELEAEMRRLRLELKQTMDMYSSACKEALSAKRKAKELDRWKTEEAHRMEEARLAEEAALAMAEMERTKCKAAIEAAEAAQRLAEMEANRRKMAEMKAIREAEEKKRALHALTQNDYRYRRYTIDEIEAATDKFAASMRIGEGGYGPVYKGHLDHTPVAIKVLRPDAAQGRRQFQQEVEVLCCIRHPNMVLLLGACPEYGCLVYEYMENGSLEDRLLRRGDTPPLPWQTRFKIAAEIATALLFLHQSKPEPLVHRDLKPANILLDRNFVSKISDVGLARLVPPSVADTVTQYHMTAAAGTFYYIDPEYQQTGMLTTKSDVYSLGILLLQIVTGKPPMGLSHHVEKAIERGRFADVIDASLADWPVDEALAFARLSLKCAQLRKKDRPDLATAVVPELNRLRGVGMRHELE